VNVLRRRLVCAPAPAAAVLLALGGAGHVAVGAHATGHGEVPPPHVRTLKAYGVNEAEAVLAGFVYPHGHLTRFWFQWGHTTSYGHVTEVSEEVVNATEPKGVEESLGDLLHPRTTYHFRIVAKNAGGKAYGGDKSFRTTPKLVRESETLDFRLTPRDPPRTPAGTGRQHTFQMAAGRSPLADEAIGRLAGWVRPHLGL
jgi:hypothetical protein